MATRSELNMINKVKSRTHSEPQYSVQH